MRLTNETALDALRYALALVFFWFGLLKLTGVSPVVDIIFSSFPWIMKVPALYILLALGEIAIGIGLIIPGIVSLAAWVATLHLTITTIGVLVSPLSFEGAFPRLSLVGEFVVKNIVLIAASLLIALRHPWRIRSR